MGAGPRHSNVEPLEERIGTRYDDPVDGYPQSYPRDDLPRLTHYSGGQTVPAPKSIDFRPDVLLGRSGFGGRP